MKLVLCLFFIMHGGMGMSIYNTSTHFTCLHQRYLFLVL